MGAEPVEPQRAQAAGSAAAQQHRQEEAQPAAPSPHRHLRLPGARHRPSASPCRAVAKGPCPECCF